MSFVSKIMTLFGVSSPDTMDNDTINDVIGNKSDNSLSGPGNDSLYGVAAFMAYYHVHSPSIIYPILADPVQVTAGAGAWTLGNKAELIAKNEKTEAFDIHFINIGTISQTDDYEAQIFTGDVGEEVYWSSGTFSRDTNQMRAAYIPVQGPPIPANTRVSVALASGNGSNSADLKLYTHEYPA